ncbi:MAG: DNA-3-methyladenine glycosylase I [Acidimicrobiales bacterium]
MPQPTAPAWTDDGRPRCPWASGPWLAPYHDEEWGVPVHSDRLHFEHLTLEAAQAGLSWLTVLKRREGYRRAFAGFDPVKVARFRPARVEALLQDPGIVRNRAKVEATVANAAAFLRVQEEEGSFDAYLWGFVDGTPVVNRWRTAGRLPASTPLSAAVSADLRRRGFRFVGPTVVYAHLQAAGLVQDHLITCFRYEQLVGRVG